MQIRKYRPSDCRELAELFYDTVHTVNAGDYTKEQLDAWATGHVDLEAWDRSFREHHTLVALEDGAVIGFGDIDGSGYLDRLYVHRCHQGKGVATALCDRLEQVCAGVISTHASITAKPFFEKRGYRVIREQQVERQGVAHQLRDGKNGGEPGRKKGKESKKCRQRNFRRRHFKTIARLHRHHLRGGPPVTEANGAPHSTAVSERPLGQNSERQSSAASTTAASRLAAGDIIRFVSIVFLLSVSNFGLSVTVLLSIPPSGHNMVTSRKICTHLTDFTRRSQYKNDDKNQMTFWMRKTNDRCGPHGAERHRRLEKGISRRHVAKTQIYAKPRPVHRAPRAVQ